MLGRIYAIFRARNREFLRDRASLSWNLLLPVGLVFGLSFAFDGQAGALDHALASPTLATQVTDILDWHINADEPAVLDYNLENDRDPALFDATTPFRSSDHDPLIIGINLVP